MTRMTSRRLKIVFLPQDELIDLLHGRLRLSATLPPDTRVVDVRHEIATLPPGFTVVLESQQFDEVPMYEMIPTDWRIKWYAEAIQASQ